MSTKVIPWGDPAGSGPPALGAAGEAQVIGFAVERRRYTTLAAQLQAPNRAPPVSVSI
jgi:hypothetical protein